MDAQLYIFVPDRIFEVFSLSSFTRCLTRVKFTNKLGSETMLLSTRAAACIDVDGGLLEYPSLK